MAVPQPFVITTEALYVVAFENEKQALHQSASTNEREKTKLLREVEELAQGGDEAIQHA